MDTVRWFKQKAKELLKSYKAGDEMTQTMFWRYILDPRAEVGLQRMQHALARSVGFNSWHALLAASDKERREIIDRWEATSQKEQQ